MHSAYPAPLPDPDYVPEAYDGVAMKRALAWVVDMLVIFAISALTIPFTAFISIFFFPAVMLLVSFLYRWITVAGSGSTWGMRLFGIEFRHMDGGRFTGQDALLHVLGYTVSLAISPLQLISALMMCFTPYGQGLTDMVLNTTAVNTSRV
ncbi:RDD family protein [Oceanicola sp. S124]|uniref:RDD family protein n=1 Tax=Oceanicola sp. S124 TaxID=1042378 RepID=UPI0002558CF6|nr:RDD family protein [Oceanicola sp. S124]